MLAADNLLGSNLHTGKATVIAHEEIRNYDADPPPHRKLLECKTGVFLLNLNY